MTVAGDVRGGGHLSARIEGMTVGPVAVGGSVVGGAGNGSGAIAAGSLGPVVIGGDLAGGEAKTRGWSRAVPAWSPSPSTGT